MVTRGSGLWRTGLVRLLLLAMVVIAPVTNAATGDNAGKVLMAVGDTSRLSAVGERGAIINGDAVNSGDTLFTGVDSRMQWRTNDGGMFALRPNTEFKVDDYQYAAGKSTGRSFFSLAKGGFRTLTGRIGRKRHDDYLVKTPVATMGIRGTHYIVQLCLAGAGAVVAACGAATPGLYLGTIAGAVLLGNDAGTLQVGPGQAAHVRRLSSPPELLPVMPGMLMDTVLPTDGSDGRGRRVAVGGGSGLGGSGPTTPQPALAKIGIDSSNGVVNLTDGKLPSEPVALPEPVAAIPTAAIEIAEALPAAPGITDPPVDPPVAPPLPVAGFQVTAVASGHVGLDMVLHSSRGVVEVSDVDAVGTDPDLSFSTLYDVSGSGVSILDAGQDPDTGIFWGRFINGVFNVPGRDAAGNVGPTDPFDNRSLHYVSGVSQDFLSVPITGSVSYALAGATSPTSNFGSTGTLNSASLEANFTNQTVLVSLEVGIDSSTWQVNDALLPLSSGQLGFEGSVPVTIGVAGSPGTFPGDGRVDGGFFSRDQLGPGAVPPGAGLGYSLHDRTGTVVSGAAAFRAQ